MKHLQPINKKAQRIDAYVASKTAASQNEDVFALQGENKPTPGMHVPTGCSFVFSPGWEVDAAGGTAGLCAPVERDIYDCWFSCYWPAQVPDHLNNAPDWTAKCASATKDWRNLDLIYP